MIEQSRGVQIFQGIISVILGIVSILLAIFLHQSDYPSTTLITFFVVGLTLILSGDYLINPFKLPVDSNWQQILSELCLIAYGVFYINIGLSRLLQPLAFFDISEYLQPVWIRRGISSIGILLIIGGIYGITGLLRGQNTDQSD